MTIIKIQEDIKGLEKTTFKTIAEAHRALGKARRFLQTFRSMKPLNL
ncbi:hypothetical protein Aeqsu_1707 [Aequorivita sublithincola DSM 14238]|uniref:Uncharacterized protein n=1 Tax=Aequorivita sublithincola (strain DSM 14238 / LMG 21431 / ACAM 643 / 9-3) TaxID=746697 RepID=I3YW20_AEQSU|nr:hypothetical protein [Aequorivita sublithincola]AFL81188.1 hypothetical protein Aeqsu_1707 [Aequorivita sublithincola DSM 14238]